VIAFFQQTWLLWWIVAAGMVLRWFHLFASGLDDNDLEAHDAGEEEASVPSNQVPSEATNRSFAKRVLES
jgi:hypothetical protein